MPNAAYVDGEWQDFPGPRTNSMDYSENHPLIERTIPMDAIDTTSTDLVIIDAELDTDNTDSFGKELTKTLLVSTATSAGVFGTFVAIALLTPKVKSLFNRKKNDVVEEEVVTDTVTPSDKK